MHSHSLEVKKEHKYESASLSWETQTTTTPPDIKQCHCHLDGATHLNGWRLCVTCHFWPTGFKGTYVCLDAIEHRRRLHKEVTECKSGGPVHRLALESTAF